MFASFYGIFFHHGLSSWLPLAIYYTVIHFLARRIYRGDDDENFGRYGILFVLAPFIVGGSWTLKGYYSVGAIACALTFLTLATFLGKLSFKSTVIFSLITPGALCAATLLGTRIGNLF